MSRAQGQPWGQQGIFELKISRCGKAYISNAIPRTLRPRGMCWGHRDAHHLGDGAHNARTLDYSSFGHAALFSDEIANARGALIVSWCGMRGIVTLATALALPNGSPVAFPYRDLIVFCAFSVVLTTLVIQGMSLRWLVERVGLRDDGMVEREIGIARAETARVALRELESERPLPYSSLREEYEARRRSGEDQSNGSRNDPSSNLVSLQRRLVYAQRQALVDLRARDVNR